MEAKVFRLTFAPLPPSFTPTSNLLRTSNSLIPTPFKTKSLSGSVLRRSMNKEEQDLNGLPKEYYDDEWQARQQEKTKELHHIRQEEEEEEGRKVDEYCEIGMQLMGYPEEDVRKARRLVTSFIRSTEEVEEKIEEAAEKAELTELVLMVIWNRLDLARRDDEKDAVRSLDLLYRRVETEILKREATPAMRLLSKLLNMHDGFDDEGWLKECKKLMVNTFPREDPFSILVPEGFDIDKAYFKNAIHHGPLQPSEEADDALLRVDFVREVDALLKEVNKVNHKMHKGLILNLLRVGCSNGNGNMLYTK